MVAVHSGKPDLLPSCALCLWLSKVSRGLSPLRNTQSKAARSRNVDHASADACTNAVIPLLCISNSSSHHFCRVCSHSTMESEELARCRDANCSSQKQIKCLENSVDRALQTRNRTLTWKKKSIDAMTSNVFQHTLFLGWKAHTLRKQKRSMHDLERRLNARKTRLCAVESHLRGKLVHAKAFLSQMKDKMMQYPQEMEVLRDEICTVQLPQVYHTSSRCVGFLQDTAS